MRVSGIVEKGVGEGAKYVEQYNALFERALGFRAFLGTLNVRVAELPHLHDGTVVQPPGGMKVTCYTATAHANGRTVKGAVVVPEQNVHKGVLEFVAKANAREALQVKDGDAVALEVRTTLAIDKGCC